MEQNNKTFLTNSANAKKGLEVLQDIIENETNNPLELNTKLLLDTLNDNKDTEYGKKYHFADIHDIKTYQKMVPIIQYEDIAEYIERMEKGETNILTTYPFNHMNETSGTLNVPKHIPMTNKQTQIYLRYNNQLIYGLIAKTINEKWMNGRAMSTAEGCYKRLPSNITIGAASSKMAEYLKGGVEELNSLLSLIYTTPVEATQSDNNADRIYIQARFAMIDKNMTGIITGFFNQVVHIFSYIAKNYRVLIQDIKNGTIDSSIKMPENVRQSLLKRIQPMPERAKELEEIFKNGSDFAFGKKIWPNLLYIFGVGGSNFATYDKILTEKFIGKEVDRIYSGITSSEGLWSFPIAKNDPSALLAAKSAFMEFLPVDANDDFSKIVTIDKLEVGKTYELIITNVNGFYRYRMRDAILVTGFYNKTPLVQFAYRTNTISLDVEKTTEIALEKTVYETAKQLGFDYLDFTIFPYQIYPFHYIFFIEPTSDVSKITNDQLNQAITQNLYKANPEYKFSAETLKRLGAPTAYFIKPSTFNFYRDVMIKNKRPASQLKPPKVLKKESQVDFFIKFISNNHLDKSEDINNIIKVIAERNLSK